MLLRRRRGSRGGRVSLLVHLLVMPLGLRSGVRRLRSLALGSRLILRIRGGGALRLSGRGTLGSRRAGLRGVLGHYRQREDEHAEGCQDHNNQFLVGCHLVLLLDWAAQLGDYQARQEPLGHRA